MKFGESLGCAVPSLNSPEMQRVARVWERFASGREVDWSGVSPHVRDAWLRSRARGVDPGLPRAPYEPLKSLEQLKRQHEWVESAEPVVRLLETVLDEPQQLLMLGDRDGRVLFVHGGGRALSRAEELRGVPGGRWGERSVGATILGTSLELDAPTQFAWQENFCESWKDWVNHSAPIHNPLTSEIVGVLGIAGYRELCHSEGLELVVRIATLIERSIRDRELAVRARLLEEFERMVQRYPSEPLIAVDRNRTLVAASSRVAGLLGISEVPLGRRLGEIPALERLFSKSESASPASTEAGVSFSVTEEGRPIGTLLLGRGSRPRPRPRVPGRHAWTATHTFSDLLGRNSAFRRAVEFAELASDLDWPILVLGESGTGKELVAQAIHNASPRRSEPFVAFSSAVMNDEILGSELFGYEEGSFTGAIKGGRVGKIQLAHKGTLFLDDVDAMSQKMQASFLRVLEEGTVLAIGALHPQPVDVRVIAASNKDPEELVRRGDLRQDLYFRLSVLSVRLPPLRERRDDIAELADHFLSKHAPSVRLTDAAREALAACAWPGNVRELRNVLVQAAVSARGRNEIGPDDLGIAPVPGGGNCRLSEGAPNDLTERATDGDALRWVMTRADNMRHAASLLGVHPSTLYRRLRRHGVEPSMTWRRKHLEGKT